MKYIIFIFLFAVACSTQKPDVVLKSDYLKLQDSIDVLKLNQKHSQAYIVTLEDSIISLKDSIEDLLLRPLMTSDQFIQLYKFERLEKYYHICKKNPTQWKYYKGWSIRVFEQ